MTAYTFPMTHYHLTWHGTVAPYVRTSPDLHHQPQAPKPGSACDALRDALDAVGIDWRTAKVRELSERQEAR
jgi:hypothetical protein